MRQTAQAMVRKGGGILAADESSPTMKKRFDSIGVESTEETRREWRDILFTTPRLEEHVNAVILFDETARQNTADGTNFVEYLAGRGIVPGIKVDGGAMTLAGFPGDKVTEGLDGLRDRLTEYAKMGLRFTKWRAVLAVGASPAAIHANANALARFAALSQEAGLVPIVEPEVLMDGTHDIAAARSSTTGALFCTFDELYRHRIDLQATVLKPNMVMSGYDAAGRAAPAEVAEATVDVMRRQVSPLLPGIAFLSGGQSDGDAVVHLRLMNAIGESAGVPWNLTFSYGRALQAEPLRVWGGKAGNREAAQKVLLARAGACGGATR